MREYVRACMHARPSPRKAAYHSLVSCTTPFHFRPSFSSPPPCPPFSFRAADTANATGNASGIRENCRNFAGRLKELSRQFNLLKKKKKKENNNNDGSCFKSRSRDNFEEASFTQRRFDVNRDFSARSKQSKTRAKGRPRDLESTR